MNKNELINQLECIKEYLSDTSQEMEFLISYAKSNDIFSDASASAGFRDDIIHQFVSHLVSITNQSLEVEKALYEVTKHLLD